MSDYVDDIDEERPQKPINGNGHEAVSAEDLRDLLSRERAQRQTAQQRAQQAERERDEARGSATTAVEQRWAAEEAGLDAATQAAESEAEGWEARIAQLNADGSFAEAAKAHRAMARAEAQISLIAQKKQWLADAREMSKQQQAQQAEQARTQQADPLARYSPKQRAWINDHPEFLNDQRYQHRVAAAHNTAMAEGIQIDSPEYFAHIDASVSGGRQQRQQRAEPEDDTVYGSDTQALRRSGGALPVTRRAPNSGTRPGEVRLSAEQREAADDVLGHLPVEDRMDNGNLVPGRYRRYAELQSQLKRQGRLN